MLNSEFNRRVLIDLFVWNDDQNSSRHIIYVCWQGAGAAWAQLGSGSVPGHRWPSQEPQEPRGVQGGQVAEDPITSLTTHVGLRFTPSGSRGGVQRGLLPTLVRLWGTTPTSCPVSPSCLQIDQPALGMPTREYYFNQGINRKVRAPHKPGHCC